VTSQASPANVQALLASYLDLAVAWDGERQAKAANRIFDRLHAIALQLRPLETGRRGLEELLDHENRGVRLKAAGDCLAWGSEAAISTLEDLVSPRGTHSLSAQMTLQEYRAGRMRFDW
jgi:HEAT repeat protein